MKKIVGIVIVLLALVSPGITGHLIQGKYEELVSQLAEGNGWQLAIQEYDRGFFRSDVRSYLELTDPEMRAALMAEGLPTAVKFTDTIYHGPIHFSPKGIGLSLGRSIAKPVFDEAVQEEISALTNGEDLLTIVNDYGWGERIKSRHELAAINYEEEDFKLSSEAATGTIDVTFSEPMSVAGEITFPGLMITDHESDMTIKNLFFKQDSVKHSDDLWFGEASYGVGELALIDRLPGEPSVSINELEFTGSIDLEDEDSLKIALQGSVEKMAVDEEEIGPANLKFQTQNIDLEAFQNFVDGVQDMQNQMEALAMDPSMDAEQAQMLMGMQMIALLPPVLSEAKMDLSELSYTMPEGTLEAEASVELPALDETSLMDQAALRENFKGNLDLRFPQAMATTLFAENPDELTMLLQQGMLKEDGEDYIIVAHFKNGELLVNDQPMPLPF